MSVSDTSPADAVTPPAGSPADRGTPPPPPAGPPATAAGAAPVAPPVPVVPAPADGAGAPGALPLATTAALVGWYTWLERRLFELTGAWAAAEPVAEAAVLHDRHSQQHAWHAELFEQRLPVLDGWDPARFTVAPGPAVEQLLADLGGTAGSGGGTLLRLVGVARVALPRLLVGYRRHLERTTEVADAPLRRVLALVIGDELAAWQAAESLVERLVRRPHDVAVLTAHQQALETPLAGQPGLVPWPGATDVT